MTRSCPTCGRTLFEPNPTIPTTNDPYLLPTLPTKFRLPGNQVPVQVLSIDHDEVHGTSTITVRQLLT